MEGSIVQQSPSCLTLLIGGKGGGVNMGKLTSHIERISNPELCPGYIHVYYQLRGFYLNLDNTLLSKLPNYELPIS